MTSDVMLWISVRDAQDLGMKEGDWALAAHDGDWEWIRITVIRLTGAIALSYTRDDRIVVRRVADWCPA